MRTRSKNPRNTDQRKPSQNCSWQPPSTNELELLKLDKEMQDMETRLLLMRRRIRAIITGDRKGNGPKVVRIDMGNGKVREVKCGTLGE